MSFTAVSGRAGATEAASDDNTVNASTAVLDRCVWCTFDSNVWAFFDRAPADGSADGRTKRAVGQGVVGSHEGEDAHAPAAAGAERI